MNLIRICILVPILFFSCGNDSPTDVEQITNSSIQLSSSAQLSSLFLQSSSSFNSSNDDSTSILDLNSGSFVDIRDSQQYAWTQIGSQIWMSENLNYDTLNGLRSICYNLNDINCEKYGRLYDWTLAVGLEHNDRFTSHNFTDKIQGVCPEGWFLPSMEDWFKLLRFIDIQEENKGFNENGYYKLGAEYLMKDEWDHELNIESNKYGFNGLAAGGWHPNRFEISALYDTITNCNDDCSGIGERTSWWSSTEEELLSIHKSTTDSINQYVYEEDAMALNISTETHSKLFRASHKTRGYPIRCLKDTLISGEVYKTPDQLSSEITTGSFIDLRDSNNYKWTKINNQVWMSENLRYKPSNPGRYKCLDTDCKRRGVYYDWTVGLAIDTNYLKTYWPGDENNVRGVCPDGWRIPSSIDWDALAEYIGTELGLPGKESGLWTQIGIYLKSNEGITMNILDFDAISTGYLRGSDFMDVEPEDYYWLSSTQSIGVSDPSKLYGDEEISYFKGAYGDPIYSFGRKIIGKRSLYPIRCIQN